MKQLLLVFASIAITSCGNIAKDRCVINAEQYVKEKCQMSMETIESIEGEVQDSLLGILPLSFAVRESNSKVLSFYNGEISEAECRAFMDSIYELFRDTNESWQYNGLKDGNLKPTKNYTRAKVVNVTITYKRQTKNPCAS